MSEDVRPLNRAELDDSLQALIGLPIWASHRAVDLESFQIGDRAERVDRKGRSHSLGAYALHIQSPWRIATSNRIAVAYGDLRYPRTSVAESDFDPDELGQTKRDELLESFFSERPGGAVIEGFTTGNLGDLRMTLAGGYALELFPDISDSDDDIPEYWRLLKRDGWHIVVTGHGIDMLP